jgi:hypothetical protein
MAKAKAARSETPRPAAGGQVAGVRTNEGGLRGQGNASASACEGVLNPRVCRGRPLSSAAMASSAAWSSWRRSAVGSLAEHQVAFPVPRHRSVVLLDAIRVPRPGGTGQPRKRPDIWLPTAAITTPSAGGCCAAADRPHHPPSAPTRSRLGPGDATRPPPRGGLPARLSPKALSRPAWPACSSS